PLENMATFALLEPLRGLMPPRSWTSPRLLVVVRSLGNYAVPLAALVGLYVVLRRRPAPPTQPAVRRTARGYVWLVVVGVLLVAVARSLVARVPALADAFSEAFVAERLRAYALEVRSVEGPVG